MKVCMIYYTFRQNSTLLREAEALTERGDQVDIICLGNDKFGKIKYKDNLNIYVVQKRQFDEKGIVNYLWKYIRFFVLASILVTFLHIRRGYKVIHVTSPPDFLVFASLLPRLLGARVILDIHDITPEFFARKLGYQDEHSTVRFLKWVESISAKYSHHVITVTDIWKRTLVRRSVPEAKCSVLLNTPDTKIFCADYKINKKETNEFTLLYPGNVDFGIDTLVKAMQIIGRVIPCVKLEVYGFGASLASLKQLAEDTGVSKIVRFNEPVPIRKLAKIMENADVGLDPIYDGLFFGEVLSVKSLEFLQIGVPVVVSRRKATEYYFNSSMVMFFRAKDEKDLARAVIDLYNRPEKRQELVRNGFEFNKLHNWNRYKNSYYEIIDSLAKKGRNT